MPVEWVCVCLGVSSASKVTSISDLLCLDMSSFCHMPCRYGLTPEQLQEVEDQLQEYVAGAIAAGNTSVAANTAAAAAAADGQAAAAAAPLQPLDSAAAAAAGGGVRQSTEEGDGGDGYVSDFPPSDMEAPSALPAAAAAAGALPALATEELGDIMGESSHAAVNQSLKGITRADTHPARTG
jgi:hypothetical protein